MSDYHNNMTEYFAGVDIGSTMTKVVISGGDGHISVIGPTGPEHRKLANRVMEQALAEAELSFDTLSYVVATGYGRINVPFADKQITEISCHARGVYSQLPAAKTVIDIGGQDAKAMKLKNGQVTDFVMNDKCAAGTGRFLEVMAMALSGDLREMGERSLHFKEDIEISSLCTVFAESEVVSLVSEGREVEDILHALNKAVADRTVSLLERVGPKGKIAMTGGVAKNVGVVRAIEEKLGQPMMIYHEPQIVGALGAALIASEHVQG